MRTIRAMWGWYGLSLNTGRWLATSSVSNIFFDPPQAFDHLHHVDTHRTGFDAPAATHAARPAVLRHEPPLLMVEAVLDAAGTRPAEILSAAHQRMALEQAGVPGARALPGARSQFHVVRHVIAVAGGADHAATAAGKALFAELVPDPAPVLHLENLGQVADFHVHLEGAALIPGAALVIVDLDGVHRLEQIAGAQDHVVAERGANQRLIVTARVVKKQIEAVFHEIGAHGTAEAVLVRPAVDADDGDVLPPRLVVRVVVFAREHPVQNVDRVNVARVNAEQDDAPIQAVGIRNESQIGRASCRER